MSAQELINKEAPFMDIYHGYISMETTVELMKKFAIMKVEEQIDSIITEVHDVCVTAGYDSVRPEDMTEVTRIQIK